MLQLQLKELDICRVSKILAKYNNIKASIANKAITLEGDISDELLSRLCDSVTICTVQNFSDEVVPVGKGKEIQTNVDKSISAPVKDIFVAKSTGKKVFLAPKFIQEYNLLYPNPKRGEVYFCDFGEPYGYELGYMRPVIVVQNDAANNNSHCAIVVPCTTNTKGWRSRFKFIFSTQNMSSLNTKFNAVVNEAVCDRIRTVDNTRLRKYLGTMTPEFMDNLQETIDFTLQFKDKKRHTIKVKKVVTVSSSDKHRNLNKETIRLLSIVNIEELFKISDSRASDEVKVEKILCLFGFDMQQNGVQYLAKAILISPKDAYFNLETLCENISKDEPYIEKDEIKRLIVARVKEKFKLKKSPTIDFIRLVNSFLSKKEDNQNEETNI